MYKKEILRIAIGVLCIVTASACAPGVTPPPATVPARSAPTNAPQATTATTQAAAPADFKVVVAYGAEDVSLDPNMSNAADWLSLLSNMYDTLVVRGPDGNLAPNLAESWKMVDDTTVELKLKQGVKFHQGQTFDANDVKFTLDRVLNDATKSQLKSYISKIKLVNVVDPFTVRLILSAPEPLIIDNLQFIPIISASFFKDKGAAALANGENGTGPYKLVEWVKGDHLTMTGVPENWRGAPKVKTAVFRVIPELASLTAALQAGEIDVAVNFPPDSAKALSNAPNFKVTPVRSQRSLYIVLDNTVKPLDDLKVRQALNYGTNVKELTDGVLLGYAEPLATLVGPMYFGYNDKLKPYPYDPGKAKQLLAEAGYKDGFTITFNAPVGRYVKDKEVAEAIAGQWAKIGVKADLKETEWGTYLNAYREHKLSPMYLIGFGTPVWDFQLAFTGYLLPSSSQSYYRDPQVQDMVNQATNTLDRDKRKQMLQDISAKLYDHAAFAFLYLQYNIYGVSNRINWTPRADERIWIFDMSPSGK